MPGVVQFVCLFILFAGTIGLSIISQHFPYPGHPHEVPLQLMVSILAGMGVVYLLLSCMILRTGASQYVLVTALLLGGVSRLALLFSTPILETDFYRYLWDGAVTAAGHNPYRISPEHASAASVDVPENAWAAELRQHSGNVLERVNHPWLKTIYPPVAQGFFAAAHILRPWSLPAWRLVLFGSDLATLALLAMLSRRGLMPMSFLIIYWWNPLLLKEIYNSAHMDALLFPFVLGALILASQGRLKGSVIMLAFATGVKLWPVLLLPVLTRTLWARPGQLLIILAIFSITTCGLYYPVMNAELDEMSGFRAYAQNWQMNESFYRLLRWSVEWLSQWSGYTQFPAVRAARVIVAILIGFVGLLIAVRPIRDTRDLFTRGLVVVAALFMLSPTQFPWYWLWMLPLLSVRPSVALLFYSVSLPLYYCRFLYRDLGAAPLFDWGIVWIEHVPVWMFLLLEWRQASTSSNRTMEQAPGG